MSVVRCIQRPPATYCEACEWELSFPRREVGGPMYVEARCTTPGCVNVGIVLRLPLQYISLERVS